MTVKSVRQRGGIPQEFLRLTQALNALGLGAVDAVVGENQQMMVLLSQPARQRLRLVGPIFETFDYGFGLPSGSPLREQLNTAILKIREDGTVQRIFE